MRNETKEKSVARLLTQVSRAHRYRLGTKLSELGLMAGQEQLLQALAEAGSMGTGDLAALLHVRPPTVSKMVSRLTASGLVERRQPIAGDNRSVLISLTSAGAAMTERVETIWREAENELLTGFDSKDIKRMRKFLRRAITNLDPATAEKGRSETLPIAGSQLSSDEN